MWRQIAKKKSPYNTMERIKTESKKLCKKEMQISWPENIIKKKDDWENLKKKLQKTYTHWKDLREKIPE